MMDRINEVINIMINVTGSFLLILENKEDSYEDIVSEMGAYVNSFSMLKQLVPEPLYFDYSDFFDSFEIFAKKCNSKKFYYDNLNNLLSSFELIVECLRDLQNRCEERSGVCVCCGRKVLYSPLPEYYRIQAEKYGCKPAVDETLNSLKYLCPICGASDRDRMIISFLKKIGLENAPETVKVLQIAPAASIERFIKLACPQVYYRTADLFMNGVDYKSDIQDLKEIEDNEFDIIICSHVLEHVQNDSLALQAMRRVLKDDGRIAFLVPVDLGIETIDEEWGCSEEENWRRFGQGDHCRRYSHNGLVERLKKYFFVNIGKDYFGEKVFKECGLIDSSILYVLTKNENVNIEIKNNELIVDKELCENGPLVSVILPSYNHAPFLVEAIESVINQTYKNIEFIIGDDASTDGSQDIIRQYSKFFAKEVYYEKNAGGCDQELSTFATGKYIALMHSDDIWMADKIAIQVSYMEAHPECAACFTWCDYIDESKNRLNDYIFIQPNRTRTEWMRYFWEKGNVLCNPSSLIRRNIEFKTIRYGNENRQLPDLFKWVDFVQNADIHVIPSRLTLMRRYNDGKRQNTSAVTQDTITRDYLERGITWLPIIRNMDDKFFVDCFKELLVNKNVTQHDAIKCEKLFLMLNSPNVVVQHSGLCYYTEIANDVKEILENEYGYSGKKYREDELKKGIGEILKAVISK